MTDTMIAFEAGRHVEAIRMICRDFERLERPLRFSFARTYESPKRSRSRFSR